MYASCTLDYTAVPTEQGNKKKIGKINLLRADLIYTSL